MYSKLPLCLQLFKSSTGRVHNLLCGRMLMSLLIWPVVQAIRPQRGRLLLSFIRMRNLFLMLHRGPVAGCELLNGRVGNLLIMPPFVCGQIVARLAVFCSSYPFIRGAQFAFHIAIVTRIIKNLATRKIVANCLLLIFTAFKGFTIR